MPQLTQTFTVNFPRDRVWRALGDVEQVVGCMPGASLTRPPDGGKIAGAMKVKLGPITAAFAGEAELTMDDGAYTGVIHGQGLDQKNNSRAKADVSFAAVEVERATRIDLTVDFTLSGMLAQFSRGAIVQEIAQRITNEFARNLEAKLAAEAPPVASEAVAPGAAAPAPAPSAATPDQPPRELNAGAILWSVVKDWVKGVFSGIFRRKGTTT